MQSFFDNKARAAAAKSSAPGGVGSSSKPASAAAATAKEENARLQPWVEKYRPKTLSDVASQDHTTRILERTLRAPNLPHMLFYGPPGTGKTSTILALAKQLFGPELYRSRVLELNASDERGINIVRTKIKDFARQQFSAVPAGPAGEAYKAQYPCPPFKIIVLDEADSMTGDAQSALRRTMETYSRITRFCLVCNYVTRIIDPLASRCSKFRFKSLDSSDAKRRVEDISKAEGVLLADGAADSLVKCAEGDLRKAITFLQSAARLVGAIAEEGGGAKKRGKKRKVEDEDDVDAMDVDKPEASKTPVTLAIVEEIAGVIPDDIIQRVITAMKSSKKSNAGTTYTTIATAVTDLIADGWGANQFISQLYSALAFDETIADKSKNRILSVFSETDKRLVDGADEHLTILDLCLKVSGFLIEQ